MGPKNFVPCYVCGKEFGAKSVTFHEPKCLARWRSENAALPASQRSPTPIKMDVIDGNESVWTCLKCYNVFPAAKRGEHFATCREGSEPPKDRPRTRTLTRNPPDPSFRPQTMTLERPTPNFEHPVIEDMAKKKKNRIAIPPPCVSCTRNGAPERLHSHRTRAMRPRRAPSRDEEENVKENTGNVGLNSVPSQQPVKPKAQRDDNTAKTPEVEDEKEEEEESDNITCYLCGRQFGTRSFPFHEPYCIERWRRDNQALPPEQRQTLPQRPLEQSTKGFSKTAWETFQAQLIPCPLCGRTFFPNRLPVHQKACKGTAPLKDLDSEDKAADQVDRTMKRPPKSPMLTCYICGRQFGSMSLTLHEPQCLKRWRHENSQLATHLQRPDPEKPPAVLREDGTLDMEAMQDAAWRSHLEQLLPCSRCGRTFYPDRLEVHERNCKGPTPTKNHRGGITVN